MEQTPRAFFQTTFEPIGRVCAARHARGGLELQGKWGARAYHTRPTCVATACLDLPLIVGRLKRKKAANTTCFSYRTLNPNSHSVLSPRGRELERGQQAARLVFGRFGHWERLPKFEECPLPSPPPRGRGRVAADSGVAGRLKKNARNINGRNFSGSLYRKADGTNAASVFRQPLNPSEGCVPQGTHAVDWGCRENGERVRAYRTRPTCRLRLATFTHFLIWKF